MYILFAVAIMIAFFYAEIGEKYKTFTKLKKIISYTLITIGIVSFCSYATIKKFSMVAQIKTIFCAGIIVFPFMFVAILTQNQHQNKNEKNVDKGYKQK